MEVEQAKAFLVLAEELHFGHAADRLNIAQPPLSRMIKQLEKQLKVELFTRSTRKVELTEAGRALIKPAEDLLAASIFASQTVRDTALGRLGTVKLGFAGASIHRSVGELARTVSRKEPGIELQLFSSQFSANGLRKIIDGELDAAIGRWDFLPPQIEAKKLATEELVVAVPKTHKLAVEGRTSVHFAELSGEDWIVLPGGHGSALHNRFNALARLGGFTPTIVTTSPDSWTLLVLVGAEIGVAVTLDSVKENVTEEHVHYLSILEPDKFIDVKLIWNSSNRNPALSTLLSLFE